MDEAANISTVTLVNNMNVFGRDIKIKEGVLALGGLLLISSSNKASKRLDNEFKEITARQSDPGCVKSFSSLEDDLVKSYYSNKDDNKIQILIEKYNNAKQIDNNKVKDIITKSQEYKENIDKNIRRINDEFNKTHSYHRKTFYKERDTIMNCSTVELCKLTENIISEYANIIANRYDIDSAKCLLGHLINVDECFDNDKVIFKEMIKNKLIDSFKSRTLNNLERIKYSVLKSYVSNNNYSKEEAIKLINKEYDNSMNSLKKKYLHIMDIYYMKYISELESIRNSTAISLSSTPLKDYELEANNEFYNNMYPCIYNEMITYALNPNYKLGDYKINDMSNYNIINNNIILG